jgi:hypothetical protein
METYEETKRSFLEKKDQDDGLTEFEKNHPELFNWETPSELCVLFGYNTLQEPINQTSSFQEVRQILVDKGHLKGSPCSTRGRRREEETTSYKLTEVGFQHLRDILSEYN